MRQPRFSRRTLGLGAAVGAVLATVGRGARAQQPPPDQPISAPSVPLPQAPSIDIPGEFDAVNNPPLIDAQGNPFPSLAGVSPYEQIPDDWQPAAGIPALPALPNWLQEFQSRVVTYKPARAGYNNHAYGWDFKKAGFVAHIPVCDTLTQLTNFFVGGQNSGLTHYGIGRELDRQLDLIAADGSVWRIPFAPVHNYLPIAGPFSPWAQGIINTTGSCAVPAHPIASRMRSGEPNGAFISAEFVARVGSQGMTDPQFNSGAMLRAMTAIQFNHPINHDTQAWHAGIDRVNRCADTGWPGGYFGGLEVASHVAARAVVTGDLSQLRGATRISTPPATADWSTEAWRVLVNTRLRNEQDILRATVREEYDKGREAALIGFDPANWEGVVLQVWREQRDRAADDLWLATARRDSAIEQLRRLGG
jgi:hypothetical protein